ncbi:MAG: hypothetical protein AB1491_04795 [Thermodesulfobacteriota bacterium]
MPGIFTYDPATHKVTVTGGTEASPADFASWVAADRAGTLTLWSGTPTTGITLTTPVRPCEKLALPLDLVIAGATDMGAGDTIGLTGTDAWGQAQDETLVAEANGTFTTSKRWRTITQVNCNGFATGTLTIRQPQWGVIWDQGGNQYQLDAYLQFGDGSTSTFFTEAVSQISINDPVAAWGTTIWEVKAKATAQFGLLGDAAKKFTHSGCALIFGVGPANSYNLINNNGGTLYLYSCRLRAGFKGVTPGAACRIINPTRAWNLVADCLQFQLDDTTPDLFNITLQNAGQAITCTAGA